eukprot:scaffold103589_cov66-Phaeocystis_antarctica.AAC.2
MVCSERKPATTRAPKLNVRRLTPLTVKISMWPSSVRLNVAARRNESATLAAFCFLAWAAASSIRPAGGLRFRIVPPMEPRRIPAAPLTTELFRRPPQRGRSTPAAVAAGLASP